MTPNARNAYLGNSVSTASPQRLLVMLCERLVLDLQRAREAQLVSAHDQAREPLLHAQDIVLELNASLDATKWSGAPALASLYDWMHSQLVIANTKRDMTATEHCLGLAEQLADTWRQAALQPVAG